MVKEDVSVVQVKLPEEWRDRLSSQQSSGQSIAVFCRMEGITEGQFYGWRSRLRKKGVTASPTLEVRIDLGHGVVLQILRH